VVIKLQLYFSIYSNQAVKAMPLISLTYPGNFGAIFAWSMTSRDGVCSNKNTILYYAYVTQYYKNFSKRSVKLTKTLKMLLKSDIMYKVTL